MKISFQSMSTMSNKNSKILYNICLDLAIERKIIKAQQHSIFFVEFLTFLNNLKLYTTRKTDFKVAKHCKSIFLYVRKNRILI